MTQQVQIGDRGHLASPFHLCAHPFRSAARARIDDIAAQNTLIRWDPAGFGLSKCDIAHVDFDEIAEDLARVADAAGVDRFALYCESGGVHPALRFAARFPDRVARLAILGGYVEGRTLRPWAPDHDTLRAIIDEGWSAASDGFASAFLISYFPEGPLEVIHQYAAMMRRSTDARLMLATRDALNTSSNVDLLEQIQCPVRIFHARRDGVHPLAEAQRLASGIRDAELVVLETANHLPILGNPVWPEFHRSLLAFLAG